MSKYCSLRAFVEICKWLQFPTFGLIYWDTNNRTKDTLLCKRKKKIRKIKSSHVTIAQSFTKKCSGCVTNMSHNTSLTREYVGLLVSGVMQIFNVMYRSKIDASRWGRWWKEALQVSHYVSNFPNTERDHSFCIYMYSQFVPMCETASAHTHTYTRTRVCTFL